MTDQLARSESLARDYDHFAQQYVVDPYGFWSALRQEQPVAPSECHGGFWVVSRYRDVVDVCQRPEVFSSRYLSIPRDIGAGDMPLPPINSRLQEPSTVYAADGKTVLATLTGPEFRQPIALSKVSHTMITAVLDFTGNKGRVFVVRNGLAEERRVGTGFANLRQIEILGGLSPEDLLIVQGQGQLQSGDRVQVMTER